MHLHQLHSSHVDLLSHDTLESILEPLDRLLAVDAMRGADAGLCAAALRDTLTGAGPNLDISSCFISAPNTSSNLHAAVEVHAVDTNRRVVLDAQIDVLRDSEAEVAGAAEVALAKLILFDLEATLEDFLCLGATDGDVHGDLLVTADTEGTDGEAGFACTSSKSQSRIFLRMPCNDMILVITEVTHCRRVFDRSAAPAPSQLWSICHQIHRRRC